MKPQDRHTGKLAVRRRGPSLGAPAQGCGKGNIMIPTGFITTRSDPGIDTSTARSSSLDQYHKAGAVSGGKTDSSLVSADELEHKDGQIHQLLQPRLVERNMARAPAPMLRNKRHSLSVSTLPTKDPPSNTREPPGMPPDCDLLPILVDPTNCPLMDVPAYSASGEIRDDSLLEEKIVHQECDSQISPISGTRGLRMDTDIIRDSGSSSRTSSVDNRTFAVRL